MQGSSDIACFDFDFCGVKDDASLDSDLYYSSGSESDDDALGFESLMEADALVLALVLRFATLE